MSRPLVVCRTCFALAAMLLGVEGILHAQINTGRITGTVRDASGAVIPDARIAATNDATGATAAAQSSESGDYVINFLIPDTYHVTAKKQGFQRSVTADVVVNAGGITTSYIRRSWMETTRRLPAARISSRRCRTEWASSPT